MYHFIELEPHLRLLYYFQSSKNLSYVFEMVSSLKEPQLPQVYISNVLRPVSVIYHI